MLAEPPTVATPAQPDVPETEVRMRQRRELLRRVRAKQAQSTARRESMLRASVLLRSVPYPDRTR